MRYLAYILLITLLFSCEEAEPKTDVYEIRNIGLLATTEYTIGKVVKLEDKAEWYKFGDRNILISCKAKVKAGIDLNQLAKGDIATDGDGVTINLPAPQILSVDMDRSQVKTEMVDVNGFRQDFTQEEKNAILAQGERSIRANIGSTNILQMAERNAELFVKDFYRKLGYNNVVVNFKKSYVPEIKIH